MISKEKTLHGSEADFEKLRHILDATTTIMEEYLSDPYDQIVRSKSFTDQQIAATFILLGYRMLRMKRSTEQTCGEFDLLAYCAKERVEDRIKQSGEDPYLKHLS